MQFRGLTLGVPKEIMAGERRVAAIPETVRRLVQGGAKVVIEAGAGDGAFFDDDQYRRAGAEIVPGPEQVFAQSDVVLKVKEPLFNEVLSRHEAELLRPGSTLVCFLHPANRKNHEMVRTLARREIVGFTLDSIPRISAAQRMDALTAMSTVAGYKAAITAAYRLSRFVPMMPTAFGMIKPAEFLVVGAGVAGLQAIATAKRLGAKVKSLDIRPEANEQAKSLGAELIEFDVPAELALGKGGYAGRLPDEWYRKERQVLAPHVQGADAVILTALIPGEVAPILVDEPMADAMKPGSAVIDIAIDQGGNCAVTRYGEEYVRKGVFVSGTMNVPATLAADSTFMFAQNIYYFLAHVVENGRVRCDADDEIIQATLVTNKGQVVHRGTLLSMETAD